METRQKIAEIQFAEEESWTVPAKSTLHGYKIARAPERNLRPNDHPTSRILEERKEGRRGYSYKTTTQAASTESYKPQNTDFETQNTLSASDNDARWGEVKARLKAELGNTAYTTWITSCQYRWTDKGTLAIVTDSDFSRSMLIRRYGEKIRRVLSTMTDGQVTDFQVVVEPTTTPQTQPVAAQPEPVKAPSAPKSPWAEQQNPGNDPEVALLLERYGDMRGVIFKHPLFKKPCASVEEGGWGISIGAMINAGKQYTLHRLIWSIRQTQAYPGVKHHGKFFFHVLRKGLAPGR